MVSRNDKGGNPLLFAIMEQDMIIFESFPVFKHQGSRLPIRFKRVSVQTTVYSRGRGFFS